ncbi:MAG TPA: hypothetical protein VG326_03295 [Tepidisphaeraceae bacterium]|nr:hypothetical protein [Tepidisphaeraceae bacterium]
MREAPGGDSARAAMKRKRLSTGDDGRVESNAVEAKKNGLKSQCVLFSTDLPIRTELRQSGHPSWWEWTGGWAPEYRESSEQHVPDPPADETGADFS